MPVLIEAISVIVRRDAVESKFPGGWEAFMGWVQNSTLCADSVIARVGFMAPQDVKHFITELESNGLTYLQRGSAVDMVVVDQQRGLAAPCDWLEIGSLAAPTNPEKTLRAARMGDSDDPNLITPDGWHFDGSLSDKFTFVETGRVPEYLDFVRTENGVQVYRDIRNGELVYTGRTS